MITDAPVGRQLAYEKRGSGEALVFLHGLTFDRGCWRPVIDRLADRFTCIGVDLPGHGESSGAPRSLAEIVRDLRVLFQEVEADHPVIVGHSMAANIASLYADTYTGVAGVINVDQPLQLRAFIELVTRMEPALRGPDFAAAFEPFRQSMGVDQVQEPLRSTVLASQMINQDLVLGYWGELFHADPDALQARIDRMLDSATVPHLFIYGRELQPGERAYLLEHVRDLRIEEWVGDGHCLHLVEPERFADRVAAFADECIAGLLH